MIQQCTNTSDPAFPPNWGSMGNSRVLVVEDETIVAEDIIRSLRRVGYQVSTAHSGDGAIEMCSRLDPDLILMDIRLKGGMDGIDAASQIQSRFRTPLVYMTAHSDRKTLERATLTVPVGYLVKPFSKDALHATVEQALGRAETDR